MTAIFIKEANLDTDLDIERTPHEHEGKDWVEASANQGMPKTASKLPKARREALKIVRRNQSCQILNFRLPVSRIVRQKKYLLFKSLGLWSSVIAAATNWVYRRLHWVFICFPVSAPQIPGT